MFCILQQTSIVISHLFKHLRYYVKQICRNVLRSPIPTMPNLQGLMKSMNIFLMRFLSNGGDRTQLDVVLDEKQDLSMAVLYHDIISQSLLSFQLNWYLSELFVNGSFWELDNLITVGYYRNWIFYLQLYIICNIYSYCTKPLIAILDVDILS